MNGKFKNKYRIPSARAQFWDYGNNAAYFITINIKNHQNHFGEIVQTRLIASQQPEYKIKLSPVGIIADKFWNEIPDHFPFIGLDEFVIMPNHIHGIIIIDKPEINNISIIGSTPDKTMDNSDSASIDTRLIAYLEDGPTINSGRQKPIGGITGNKNPMLNDNLSRAMRWYKGRTAFECRKIQIDFEWQGRFHDHIIRNESEYQFIRNYIITNPQNWYKKTNHKIMN